MIISVILLPCVLSRFCLYWCTHLFWKEVLTSCVFLFTVEYQLPNLDFTSCVFFFTVECQLPNLVVGAVTESIQGAFRFKYPWTSKTTKGEWVMIWILDCIYGAFRFKGPWTTKTTRGVNEWWSKYLIGDGWYRLAIRNLLVGAQCWHVSIFFSKTQRGRLCFFVL
jgi:hypothetical protein